VVSRCWAIGDRRRHKLYVVYVGDVEVVRTETREAAYNAGSYGRRRVIETRAGPTCFRDLPAKLQEEKTKRMSDLRTSLYDDLGNSGVNVRNAPPRMTSDGP
jgi:hypothetical protein